MLNIIQNERKPWSLTLKDSNGAPFDLTGATNVLVCFKADNTVIELNLAPDARVVIDNAVLGKISGYLTQAETDTMPATNKGDLEISADFGGGDVRKAQVFNAFIVKAKLC